MTVLMDDPTTYLTRDTEQICLVLAGSVDSVMVQARMYGVSVQVNMPGGKGIRAITNQAEAMAAVAAYPPTTPWCLVNDGLWEDHTRRILRAFFGNPKTMDKALGVNTVGIAWRPDKMKVF